MADNDTQMAENDRETEHMMVLYNRDSGLVCPGRLFCGFIGAQWWHKQCPFPASSCHISAAVSGWYGVGDSKVSVVQDHKYLRVQNIPVILR